MKQWTREDLILLYYGELSEADELELKTALQKNASLKDEYESLCALLQGLATNEVPAPSEDLNERIMVGVNQAVESEFSTHSQEPSTPAFRSQVPITRIKSFVEKTFAKLNPTPLGQGAFVTAGISLALLMVGVFYLGRVSTELTQPPNLPIASNTVESAATTGFAFSDEASRRILLSNVSSHLEVGSRLLTSVSNSEPNMPIDLADRKQMIEDLISFNRLYRRAAERSNDANLATVLQQMERILLQLHHLDQNAASNDDGNDLNEVRSRLDASDLLFKMKVANKKIEQEFI